MTAKDAIAIARSVKAGRAADPVTLRSALLALLEHGDQVEIPDFEASVRMVAAHIHGRGKFYIEIAVDPQTKKVGWTFTPTERDEVQHVN